MPLRKREGAAGDDAQARKPAGPGVGGYLPQKEACPAHSPVPCGGSLGLGVFATCFPLEGRSFFAAV